MTIPRRYSDLTKEDVWALRLLAALEIAYPQAGSRNTQILAGYDAWRAKRGLAA